MVTEPTSLVEQLNEIRRLAIEHGLYDADDWIVARLLRDHEKGKCPTCPPEGGESNGD